ncbi:MAG: YbhB/YbcL family Raf kinase inhibitor-like protein, partial [Pseudomonadota bacterium]|nr:YbhB/YbcL family Raf kinase inhibitor-like protein [Pseudomonadota bacterium]
MAFVLRSPVFNDGDEIPSRYTNEGANVSPPLEWSGAPDGTRSFVLVMEDPDAPGGMFHHWGLYDIEGARTMLPEAIGHGVKTETMGHGVNDFEHPRYDGPAPPEEDTPHRYVFRLGALDLEVPTRAPKRLVADIWESAQPHLLGEAVLTGTYVSRHHKP